MKDYYSPEIGKKYNKLTVLERSGSFIGPNGKSHGTKWFCKCDCGKEGFYRGSSLIKGISKSCIKCSSKLRQRIVIKKGDVFNRLEVLSEDFIMKPKGKKSKVRNYQCKCECGDINYYNISHLNSGRSRECKHCAYKRRPQSTMKYSNIERLYNLSIISRLKSLGKDRNIQNFLTIEQFENIISKNCYYCGNFPRKIDYLTGNNRIVRNNEILYANGIDRINSDGDYHIDNCVPCCKQCNVMKMNFTQTEFYEKIKQIIKHLKL